jgi:hypothetical protein
MGIPLNKHVQHYRLAGVSPVYVRYRKGHRAKPAPNLIIPPAMRFRHKCAEVVDGADERTSMGRDGSASQRVGDVAISFPFKSSAFITALPSLKVIVTCEASRCESPLVKRGEPVAVSVCFARSSFITPLCRL